jgi:hypothetical protein
MDEIQLDSRKSYRRPCSSGAERAVDGGAHGGERERLGDHVVDQRVEAMGASAVMDGGGSDGGRRASRCRRDGPGVMASSAEGSRANQTLRQRTQRTERPVPPSEDGFTR